MFKKLKIGAKLILIGGILLILPILIIAYFAINQAGDGIKELEREQLEKRTEEIAQGIDNVLDVQKNVAMTMAALSITVDALTSVETSGLDASSAELDDLSRECVRLIGIPGFTAYYDNFIMINTEGIVVAADNPDLVDVSVAERDYFLGALKGNVSIGSPAINKVTGQLFVGIAAPVRTDGSKIVGVAAILMNLDFLGSLIANATIGDTGYAFMVDSEGTFIAHPNDDVILKDNIGNLAGMEEIYRRTNANENGVENYVYQGIPKTSGFASVALTGWSVCLSLPDEEYLAPVDAVRNIVIIVGVISFAIAMMIFILFSRSITKPLIKAVEFAGKIAEGDLSVTFVHKSRDEVGILADALRRMVQALQYKAEIVERFADGNLTGEVEKASDRDGLGQSLQIMKKSLTEILSQVMVAADQVTSGSDQVSQASQSLSQGATEQASSLEEISSSINEINSQSKQNAENATEANVLAKQSAEGAERGNDEMKNLMDAMSSINSSSDEIKKVVKVIDDIAFQINLLALNANVEAARAGKYGKGFAVVAEEVRNLAVKSADAVKETTMMVDESIRSIEQGNKSVEATAKQLEEIVAGVSKVATFLDEIAVASKEQAQGIDQITEGLDQIEQVTQANTASAEESASAAEELAGQAQELQSLIGRFKLETKAMRHLPAPETGGEEGFKGMEKTATRKPAGTGMRTSSETGIRPVDPAEVIQLDDDDFDRF